MSHPADRKIRKRPAVLRALGNHDPPEHVSVLGATYRRGDILKHDSWAATAVYCNDEGKRIICKFNRIEPVFGIPLAWVGRSLAARESRFLRKLSKVELIPKDLGGVASGGQLLRNAIARSYIRGKPLRVKKHINPRVFRELRELLQAIHAQDMAYVDLHKLENIIVDPENHPYLIDFQVCFGLSDTWPGNGRLARLLLAKLQEIDVYCLNKHITRLLPQMLTRKQLWLYSKVPLFIRVHRRFAAPLRAMRRKLLVRLRIRAVGGAASSELEPEDAYHPAPHRDK